jgi:1-acyl-sn-glycerol-3-phosphate acyltransferase
MRILIQIKAVLVSLFAVFFVLLPAGIIAAPFKVGRRLKIIGPAWKLFGELILRYACHGKIDVVEDHRSEYYRGTPARGLYIANHQSYLDIPLLTQLYQLPPIMKQEVLYIPVFGLIAWSTGALPVSRSSSSSRRKVFDLAKNRILSEGVGLQVYPEGTRSKDALPKAFKDIKKTLLVFAFNEKIPVIPTSMYGTRGVLSSKGMITPGRHLGLIVHKEIDPKNFESAEAFAETCWKKVVEGHDELKAKLGPLNENLS